MTMPCGAVGVGMTCRSLLGSAAAAGYRVDLATSRFDPGYDPKIPVRQAMGSWFRNVPYVLQAPRVEPRLHRDFIEGVLDGEIAYLWPSVPLSVYEPLHARGVPIVAEAINTHMAVARPILEAAYAELGLPPAHGITDERIANQNARYALCTAIFTPSAATESSLGGIVPQDALIRSSYGTWLGSDGTGPRTRSRDEPVRFVFVGLQSVRKGLPTLLRAWRDAPRNAELMIVGEVEPAVAELFADELNLPNVTTMGFTADVAKIYRAADVFVFPTLEEGDAIVTYEAAAHGLAIIATEIGAGRIGQETGCACIVPPGQADVLAAQIRAFAASAELRHHWATRARAAVLDYDWSVVGPRSFAALHASQAVGAAMSR